MMSTGAAVDRSMSEVERLLTEVVTPMTTGRLITQDAAATISGDLSSFLSSLDYSDSGSNRSSSSHRSGKDRKENAAQGKDTIARGKRRVASTDIHTHLQAKLFQKVVGSPGTISSDASDAAATVAAAALTSESHSCSQQPQQLSGATRKRPTSTAPGVRSRQEIQTEGTPKALAETPCTRAVQSATAASSPSRLPSPAGADASGHSTTPPAKAPQQAFLWQQCFSCCGSSHAHAPEIDLPVVRVEETDIIQTNSKMLESLSEIVQDGPPDPFLTSLKRVAL